MKNISFVIFRKIHQENVNRKFYEKFHRGSLIGKFSKTGELSVGKRKKEGILNLFRLKL